MAEKPNPNQEVIDWIDQELARPIDRPETGNDLLDLRTRLKTAKELGALRDELKSGKAQVVSSNADAIAKPSRPVVGIFPPVGGAKND
jgi:hypothetical protein